MTVGQYLEVPQTKKKASQLKDLHGAEILSFIIPFHEVPEGKVLICVVDNGAFEAAAICYNEREFNEFIDPNDIRFKTWLLMDKEKVKELNPQVPL